MTISYGLCWNIDSRKIIWPPRAHFGSENESLKGLRRIQKRLKTKKTTKKTDIRAFFTVKVAFSIMKFWAKFSVRTSYPANEKASMRESVQLYRFGHQAHHTILHYKLQGWVKSCNRLVLNPPKTVDNPDRRLQGQKEDDR